jgi:hypothetical protein
MEFGEGLREPLAQKVKGPFNAGIRQVVVAKTETATGFPLALLESTRTPEQPRTWAGQATAGLGVTVRHGRHLADYILRLLPESDREVFLREVLYAACEALEKLDWWPLAETMNGWEATAEVEENPQFAKELDEAIAAYRADH